MSYARLDRKSDVYVYLHESGYLKCSMCRIEWDARFKTTAAMLEHLEQHRAAGHRVADSTFRALENDRADNDLWMAGQ